MAILWLVKHQNETGKWKVFSLGLEEKKKQHSDFLEVLGFFFPFSLAVPKVPL